MANFHMCGFHSTNSITYLETQSSGFILNVLKLWIDIAERRYEKIKVLWCFAGIATIRLTTNNSSTSYTSQCWDHSKIVANMYQHEVKKYDSSLMLHKDAHINGYDEHRRQSKTSMWDCEQDYVMQYGSLQYFCRPLLLTSDAGPDVC